VSRKTSPTLIGAFVIGATVLIATAVALFGGTELFRERYKYVAYFEEQTKGLRVGSNVEMNGVRIGYVSEISLLIDEATYETITRVTLEILPDAYIEMRGGEVVGEGMEATISHDELVNEAGVRALVEIESFITGQLLVRLDLRPETEAVLRDFDSPYPEIPTITSDIQALLTQLQDWFTGVSEDVELKDLTDAFTDALRGIADLTHSGDLEAALAGINALINNEDTQRLSESLSEVLAGIGAAAEDAGTLFRNTDRSIAELSGDIEPVLEQMAESLVTAQRALDAARLQLSGNSEQVYQLQSTLREVERASAALREFFDYLERNPEALLRGKQP